MSNLDETFERMQVFRTALQSFGTTLGHAIRDMRAKYQAVAPHWDNDQAHQTYLRHWQPLDDILERFVQHEVATYDDFLDQKLRALQHYLHG
jgi:hypothetical protein